jgi:glyoxylase-like metal-dependent hydrolase (beta-lactamase superfamily II)
MVAVTRRKLFRAMMLAAAVGMVPAVWAAEQQDATQALRLHKVNEQVFAIVGPYGNRTPQNLGNNATFGFVVTGAGVVLVDPGGSYQGAAAIDRIIKQVTDQPVKIVIDSGGQDHRWLGNGYFKQRGARILASQAAVADQHQRLQDQMFMLGNLIGVEALEGTEPVYATGAFDDKQSFELGGVRFELLRVGPAHTPGDTLVWLPQQRIVFTGDVAYVGRLPGIMSHSDSRHWIKAFDTMAALQPDVVVPGHGPPTDLADAREDTYDYLVFLRKAVGAFMEAGGDITRIGTLDQSRFSYLKNFKPLSGRNAQQVYQQMEWE